ncbi:MAG: ATP-binding protein [Myxococcota bacterium]
MSGLFARIFIGFWAAITVVTVGFVLIAVATFPEERKERRDVRMGDSMTLRGQRAVDALAKDPAAKPDLGASPDQPVWLVKDGKVVLPRDPLIAVDPLALAMKAVASGDGTLVREEGDDTDRLAIGIGGGWAMVTERPSLSPFSAILEPRSLPWRILLVVIVAGLVAVALARYLTRPLRTLREATAKIASGELDVRVTPEVGRAGGELAALGRDFDAMAERLEVLLESQRRLLRDVSHELRSPLARLGVALELARKRSGPEVKGDLDRIERESERLAALVGEILTLTKLEAAEAAEPETPIDMKALVESIAADVDYEARGSNRRVVITAAEALTVPGRPEALRRAIENVLRNAARFTPEGTAVELALVARDDGGKRMADVVVSDQGPGVPEAALRDIFKPFYRVGEDRDRKTGGAGIGLAIVERAVRLHGGSVVAKNRPALAGAVAATGAAGLTGAAPAHGGLEIRLSLPLAA